jgi:hemolysin activation/secretion protein
MKAFATWASGSLLVVTAWTPELGHAQRTGTPGVSSGSLLQQQPLTPLSEQSSSLSRNLSAQAPQETEKVVSIDEFVLDGDITDAEREKVWPLLSHYLHGRANLAGLEVLRLALAEQLRRDGPLLTVVKLDPNIDAGRIHYEVLRGHIESFGFENRSLLRTSVLRAWFAARPERTSDLREVQHTIDLLGDLPGVGGIQPSLSPGDEYKGTKVTIATAPDQRWAAAMVADNQGTTSSGKNRIGAQMLVNSPLGIGDRFQLSATQAPSLLQDKDGKGSHTLISNVTYDAPLGYDGTRAGLQFARVDYTLGGAFEGFGDGYADIYRLYVNRPVRRTERSRLNLEASVGYKQLNDTFFDIDNERRARFFAVGLSGYRQNLLANKPNVLEYSAELKQGIQVTRSKESPTGQDPKAFDGRYTVLQASTAFTQLLSNQWQLSAGITMQLASHHLDPSEQMVLGGPGSVRAYATDIGSADQGVLMTVAVTRKFKKLPKLSLQAFYDAAHAQLNRNPSPGSANTVNLQGVGTGLAYQAGKRISLNLSYARRVGNVPAMIRAPTGQVWAQAVVTL